MFKKRTIKASTRKRETSPEQSNDSPNEEQESLGTLGIEDLMALRKLRKSKQGIEIDKLNRGDIKKKRKKTEDEEEAQYGLQKSQGGQATGADDEVDEEDEEAKARRLVRSNNFTQQTNKLDVDKHMMAYIEENMKALRGETADTKPVEEAPWDPHAQLYQIEDKYKARKKESEEGNVTNSMAMLTAIPEVDLGIDVRLRNIEDTEKAKRTVEDEKRAKQTARDEDGHLAATRFFLPRQPVASDAVALRNAQLEAMGIDVPEPRKNDDRKEMATDDVVMERFKKRMRR